MKTIFELLYQHTIETIRMPLKKFFRHFIQFLFSCSLKRTNIWMGNNICFVF